MTDERIRTALKGALDPIEPPAKLLAPERLIQRHRTVRRSLAAAVAAVLVALTAFSPIGSQALAAARGLVMSFRLEPAPAADRQAFLDQGGETTRADLIRLKPGEVRELPELVVREGLRRLRTVYRGTTLAAMRQQAPDLPLPTHFAPVDAAAAVIMETYDGERINETAYWLTYPVQVAGRPYEVQWQYIPGAPPAADGQVIMPYTDPAQMRTQTLTVNGQTATALSLDGGASWAIPWQADTGRGFVGGTLPLAELVKVAESIPLLQP